VNEEWIKDLIMDHWHEMMSKQLKDMIPYFEQHLGQWVELDDYILPKVGFTVKPCQSCGGKMSIRLYIPTAAEIPFFSTGDVKMTFRCVACKRFWIDNNIEDTVE
jgi:hypothetical protein